MQTQDRLKERIRQLVADSEELSRGHGDRQSCKDAAHTSECIGWFAAATNVVQLVCPWPMDAYRKELTKISVQDFQAYANNHVGTTAALLRRMLADIEDGLLSSIVDRTVAETFDDFLDHAEAYLREGRKNPAGVIAGVIFEDSIRRICRKNDIAEAGRKMERLFGELTKARALTSLKIKRARPAEHVRKKATHAQWDDFEAGDVEATIKFTRELIDDHLA